MGSPVEIRIELRGIRDHVIKVVYPFLADVLGGWGRDTRFEPLHQAVNTFDPSPVSPADGP